MIKVKDQSRVNDILSEIEYLQNHKVLVGVFAQKGSDLFFKAFANEYGVQIRVTEKQRNYLHLIGLHLSPDTLYINVPERSFIRSTFYEENEKVKKMIKNDMQKVLDGKMSGKQLLEKVGLYLQGQMRRKLTDIKEPPNHPFTIENKGSSNPLIDSGQLRSRIEYRIVGT